MSSTEFTGQVTQIPPEWANAVDALVYDVFGGATTLSAIKTLLGLGVLTSGGTLILTGGSINDVPIGGSQPNTGRFTSVKIVNAGLHTQDDDVVVHSQLIEALAAAGQNTGSLAAQEANAVAITGGSINGTTIGQTTAAAGTFTTLKVSGAASQGQDVINLQVLNSRLGELPSFGSIVGQNFNAVSITGGQIDGTVIGATVPAAGGFTRITTSQLYGANASVCLDNELAGSSGYAFFVEGTSDNDLDMGFNLKSGGRFTIAADTYNLAFADGRLVLNGLDDGITALQTNGAIKATQLTVSTLIPTAAGQVTSKQYVDLAISVLESTIAPTIAQAISGLGNLADQDADSVSITGGSVNGVNIGGTVRGTGAFSSITTDSLSGQYGALNMAGTGGYASSGLVLNAVNGNRPNVSVVPNLNGAFAVMGGANAVFRVHAAGRTVVGLGGDDGQNELQVYGDMVLHGRQTLDSGTMSGSYSASLGDNAPSLVDANSPLWVRVRVKTADGVKECVMPAFEVM